MKAQLSSTDLKKDAIRKAYLLLVDKYNYGRKLVRFDKMLDMRYSVNKLCVKYIKELENEIDFETISIKRKERFLNKLNTGCNSILNNPIVIDFLANRNSIDYIGDKAIHFISGRNHWAKNEKDLKILRVLSKAIK